MEDNQTPAFSIKEGANNYQCFVTANRSEYIAFGCGLAAGEIMSISQDRINSNVMYSGAGIDVYTGYVSGANITLLSASIIQNISDITDSANDITALSGAHSLLSGAFDLVSGAIDTHFGEYDDTVLDLTALSGAHSTLSGAYDVVSSDLYLLSGMHSDLSGAYAVTSGAIDTHMQDSSDPHGVELAQTRIKSTGVISGAFITSTGNTSGACANIYYGTSTTPPASTVHGSVYLTYTA